MGIGLDLSYATLAAATSPLWAYRLLRTGKWRTDWRSRFGHCQPLPDVGRQCGEDDGPHGERRTLLIHAVSVGEVNAVRLLVSSLGEADKDLQIVISTTTDTGADRARSLFAPLHPVVRFPLDLTRPVRRFLDAVQPHLVALVENEVWPNFVSQCTRRGVPVCVVNGRLTERSFRRYRLVKPIASAMYGRLDAAAVQTEQYARHFIALGTPAERVCVLDTMKWDTAEIADHVDGADDLATAMGIDRSRPVIVAGSTAPGEEQLLIDTCPHEAQLVLVPRKPERFEQVAQLAPRIVRRTKHPSGTARPIDGQRLFLIDTIGELRMAYAVADVALVGRSFLGLHGSDMIEPIALGKPTIIGHHHSNFADTMAALRAGGGIEVTDNPGAAMRQLLSDRDGAAQLAKRGRDVITARQGSTERHVALLMRLLDGTRTASARCGNAQDGVDGEAS